MGVPAFYRWLSQKWVFEAAATNVPLPRKWQRDS